MDANVHPALAKRLQILFPIQGKEAYRRSVFHSYGGLSGLTDHYLEAIKSRLSPV